MIGYIRLMRDTGKLAWIRADEIAAFHENETKVDKEMVACTTILLRNNVAWHFPGLSGASLVRLMGSASGVQVNETDETALG